MTDAAIQYSGAPLPEVTTGTRATGWWGMVWLCVTEAMLFACLIASYFFLRGSVQAFAAEGGHYPSLTLPIPMTVLLVTSSGTMWWGERGIRRGDQRRLRIGLALTFVLGAVFLVLQGIEFSHGLHGPTASAYESIFYTTTGLHGAHVAMGLLMNLYAQLQAWRGHFSAKRHLTVQNVSLYWHFVDAVWIVILTTLYLSPRLW
ncbi:MAG TPA: cytochrome c oxidase subunit 3 [Gemmatimonadaceae bacterium]|jgi:heme/copper-type cytochrome/quinol oxidase subunit 3